MKTFKLNFNNKFKKEILEIHQLLIEFEEKIISVTIVKQIEALLDYYLDKIVKVHNKLANLLDNFEYDKDLDTYLASLSDEINILIEEFVDLIDSKEIDDLRINEFVIPFVNLVEARNSRISNIDSLLTFLNKNNIEINKEQLYKKNNFKDAKILENLEFNQDDALYIKNELFVDDITTRKFKDLCYFMSFETAARGKKPEYVIGGKNDFLDLIQQTINELKELGIYLSDSYKNISYDVFDDISNYELIKVSFLDASLKNLVNHNGTYKDFVFVKNFTTSNVVLFYSIEDNSLFNQSIMFEDQLSSVSTPVYVSFKKELFEKFFKNKMTIKNEDSLYKISNECSFEIPNGKIYTTLEFVKELISCSLIKANSRIKNPRSNMLFLCSSKFVSLICAQTEENILKGPADSFAFTDINSDIHSIISIFCVNKSFVKKFKKYKSLTINSFLKTIYEIQEKYELIASSKQAKDENYINNIDMPMPIFLLFVEESLDLLLSKLDEEKHVISKKFVNELYKEIKSNEKLYNQLLNLNKSFIDLNFDGDLDFNVSYFDEDDIKFKA